MGLSILKTFYRSYLAGFELATFGVLSFNQKLTDTPLRLFRCLPVFPGGERTHFTCSSPHFSPHVRLRCGEGKNGRGNCGVLLEWGQSDVAEWVQCDVGLANLVYTRLRALWRSGGAMRRERERERERRVEQMGVSGEEG